MTPRSLSSTDVALRAAHDALWFDLDGVVYRSAEPVDHAIDSIRACSDAGTSLTYLTNNASRTPHEVAEHLVRLGLDFAAPHDIATSAQAIAAVMAAELAPGAAVLVIGGFGLRQAVTDAGLELRDNLDPDLEAVVQGYAPGLTWEDLARAAYAIQGGARWFASNDDLTIPTSAGTAPGNGSLVQAVGNAVDVEPTIAGKPHAPLFDLARNRTRASAPLMIGDRIDTDIVGANRAGVASLWVATGVDTIQTVSQLPPADRPDYVAPDLRALSMIHPPVECDAQRARCGDAEAVVRSGRVEVSGGDPLAALRAAVGLAWHVADTSGELVTISGTLSP